MASPSQVLRPRQVVERLQHRRDLMVDEALDARATKSRAAPARSSSASRMTRGRMMLSEAAKLPHRVAEPAHHAVGAEREVAVAAGMQPRRTCLVFERERLLRGGEHGLGVGTLRALVRHEAESGQLPDMVPLDIDVAVNTDFSFKHRILSQALHEHGSPAVNEAFRQPFMQGVGQSILDFPGLFLPVCRIGKPAGAVRDVGPCADLRDPAGQRLDLAVGAVGPPHLLGEEVLVDLAAAHEVGEDGADQLGMLGRRDAAIVGQRAGLPERLDALRRGCELGDFRKARPDVRAPAGRPPAGPASARRRVAPRRGWRRAGRGSRNRAPCCATAGP